MLVRLFVKALSNLFHNWNSLYHTFCYPSSEWGKLSGASGNSFVFGGRVKSFTAGFPFSSAFLSFPPFSCSLLAEDILSVMYFSLIHCSSKTLGRGGVDRNDVAGPKALGGFDLWQAVCPQECCCQPSRVISFITRHGLLKSFSNEADVLMVAAWHPTGLLQVSKKNEGLA